MRTVGADEKLTPVMVYTKNMLIRAEVLTKQNVRVGIWLRTDGAPRYMTLLRPQLLVFGGRAPRSTSYAELLLPVEECIAFHIIPPTSDGIDYDEQEKNRVNFPLELLLGSFLFKGKVRISTQADMASTLEVTKAPWLSIYEFNVSNYMLPQFSLNVQMGLIRPNIASFAFHE